MVTAVWNAEQEVDLPCVTDSVELRRHEARATRPRGRRRNQSERQKPGEGPDGNDARSTDYQDLCHSGAGCTAFFAMSDELAQRKMRPL